MDIVESSGVFVAGETRRQTASVKYATGEFLAPSDVATVSYSVSVVDDANPRSETTVVESTELTVADVLLATPVNDELWDGLDDGYNFRHQVIIDDAVAFRKYVVTYTITLTSGDVVKLRYRLSCI